MRRLLRLAALLWLGPLGACATAPPPAIAPAPAPAATAPRWGLVVHGGAGTMERSSMTAEVEAEYRGVLEQALRAGHEVLAGGGGALDAVIATIRVLEDSPLFNAGKGAVFTADGKNELDAALMDGTRLRAGAVAGVTHVRNPITLARAVMEKSPHVMLTGQGAEAFAQEQGIELVDESYFFTQRRWDALQRAKAAEARPAGAPEASAADVADRKFGTVGAVALDQQGRLAAGTSTGGMTNKRWGRVGDVPIIGGGTYANGNCGVSATGHGEFFIRNVVAYDICARVEYTGATLAAAARAVVMEKLVTQGGEGGVIAMDAEGNYTTPFNSSGMYRGYVGADGKVSVAIFRD